MTESLPKPQSLEKKSKVEALAAYRKIVERGFTSPDGLDLNDPQVAEANTLFDKWQSELGDDARSNFEKTKFYIDAGFTDPDYLSDVLGWLYQDAGDIEKNQDNSELVQLLKEYADEIRKIRNILGRTGSE